MELGHVPDIVYICAVFPISGEMQTGDGGEAREQLL